MLYMPTVSVQKLRKMLATTGDEIVLLDVRTFYERNETKPYSVIGKCIFRGVFLRSKPGIAVPKDKTIIVYCSKGTRSKLAVRTLQDMDWAQVSSLEGGIKAWYESVDESCGCLPENQEIPDR